MMKMPLEDFSMFLEISVKALAGNINESGLCSEWRKYYPFTPAQKRQEARHQRITRRGEILARLQECVCPDGLVRLEEGGMDCDCVQYRGIIRKIKPTLQAWEAAHYEMNRAAEGPCWLQIVHPDDVESIKYQSRDLAMEAWEDGHPHVVYREPMPRQEECF